VQLGDTARHWLAAATRSAASELAVQRLRGSTSSSIFLIETGAARATRFVLRVLDNAAWLAKEPDLAAHEAAALIELQRARLNGPELVAHGAEEAGFGAPVVLMSLVEGRVDLTPVDLDGWLSGLAVELVSIHAHAAQSFPWPYRSWLDRRKLSAPEWARKPELWQRAIDRARQPPPPAPPVFLHRDYHPTNVLWHGQRVSGVVDWINACRGPAGVDVAHCRTNLAMMLGPDAAQRFLDSYHAHGGAEHDAYWDLESLLLMSLPEPRFYAPWRAFGLAPIADVSLRERCEAHLERALRRC
jgi:aminoglycoside phosphotransferase (APT) family kinase protein